MTILPAEYLYFNMVFQWSWYSSLITEHKHKHIGRLMFHLRLHNDENSVTNEQMNTPRKTTEKNMTRNGKDG